MKIIDKISQQISQNNIYYSFEYFPPKTKTGKQNLFFKIEKMSRLEPLFIDITWGAGGSTSDLTLEICDKTQNILSVETQMHLTCTNMDENLIKDSIKSAVNKGITNILALRGDPPEGTDKWNAKDLNFQYAVDLVKYIRKEYGNNISICVAGYPEGHPDGNYQDDLKYLLQKFQAGADFIITQLFFDVKLFLKFYQDCRNIGISCPILPGILLLSNYNSFKRMTGFCKVHVPQNIIDDLEPIKNDDAAVTEYGIKLAVNMCKELISNKILGLHFYTLNKEASVTKVLEQLGLLKNLSERRALPWKARIGTNESTRPIFWANLKEYYINRTSDWNKFPNGRWGDSSESQYGHLQDYHLFGIEGGTKKNKLKLWGKPETIDDIKNVFINYLLGKISYIPWSESVVEETNVIQEKLINIIKKGYLTINSQPKMNGLPSDNKLGWGGKGGYIYQKEYLEFFTSPKNLEKLLTKLDSKKFQFCAVNLNGDIKTNCNNKTIVVTWGIFPDKQVIQPTIVNYKSFMIWKKDAFSHWLKIWGNIYDKQNKSYQLLESIEKTYYLVFVVSNDYINGDIFNIFE